MSVQPSSISRPQLATTAMRNKSHRRSNAGRGRAAFWFLAPACLMTAVYVLYPIFYTLCLSFFNWDGMMKAEFVGLANYREMLHAPTFYVALKNNLTWLLLFLLAPPAGLMAALYLNQKVRGMRVIKALFFTPFVLSGVVVGLIFSWFYDPTFGLLTLILGHGVPVLGDARYVTYGIIFAALWPQTAYCMILFLTGLTAINHDQVEAARMEGAKGWSMLRYVILPQLRPTTFMAFVVTIIGALRSFDLIAVMSSGGPYESSTVLAYYTYDQAIKYYRQGYSAAIAVTLFAIMLVYIIYQLRSMLRAER